MTKWQSILAALKSGAWVGVVGTLLGVGVTVGLLTGDQSDAVAKLVAELATVVQLVVASVHTFHAAKLIRNASPAPLGFPHE